VSAPNDYLSAPVPRSLRVRASLQIGGTRLPARSFVLLMALLLVSGIAIARGADLVGTAQVAGVLAAAGMTLLEGRWWGYSSAALAGLLLTHIARPRTLELSSRFTSLPPQGDTAPTMRRPLWRQEAGVWRSDSRVGGDV
jgi:hypothetical protein